MILLAVGLAAADVARSTIVAPRWHLVFTVALAVLAIGLALTAGLRADELGCSPAHLGAGLRFGGIAFAVISAVLAVAAVAGLLHDERSDVGASAMLVRVLVVIPVGTVLAEELIFRGALDGLLRRVMSPARSMALGSLLFGLWHVPPIAGDRSPAAVLGTVAATTAAGAGFTWLRRRSGSILAPTLAHLGTNSTTFALSWAVSR